MANGAPPDAWLEQWQTWLSSRTDALLSLDERVRTGGSGTDAADVAAAFVARKAITDRLAAMIAAGARNGAAAALAAEPVLDDMGGRVGDDLDGAARLLDAVLQRVESRIAAHEQVNADLARSSALAQELGMQVNHVASLRERVGGGGDLAAVGREAADALAGLQAADAERARLLAAWSTVAARLDELATVETRVREAAARCREKVVQSPPIAVPSVEAFREEVADDLSPSADLRGVPWAGARGRIVPVLARLDRLAAALAEAEQRFAQPLRRRDDLRGLLQSFAGKASAHGVLETAELDGLFREAKDALWSAPCDLVAAQALVDRYVAAVNEKIEGVSR
ncbi:MAG: hypothetical protein Q7V57_03900 [Actinomycetota bacterium]|nr:hypothetical protein [Actinomycetota bacterium]